MKTILVSIMVLAGGSVANQAAYVWDVHTEYGQSGSYDTTRPYGLEVATTSQQSVSVFAGQYRLTSGGISIPAYCVEITYLLGTPATYNYWVDPLSEHASSFLGVPGSLQKADYLYTMFGSSLVPRMPPGELGSPSPEALAAALQSAIWTSLYGTANFAVKPSDTGTQADVYRLWGEYLEAANTANAYYGSAWWRTDTEKRLQGLISSPVPESKYFGLASVLFLSGLIGWEIRRGRRTSAIQ